MTKLLLEGDMAECARHVPFARKDMSVARDLDTIKNAPTSSATVRMNPWKSQVHIRAGEIASLYMESRFFDARIYGDLESYQEPAPFYDTPETAAAHGQKPSYLDQLLIGEQLSSVESPTDVTRVMPGGVHDKRDLILPGNVSPSWATGLLRRWCEALIGRASAGYKVPTIEKDNAGQQSKLNQETMELVSTLTNTSLIVGEVHPHDLFNSKGLFRGPDYQYFFIDLDQGNLIVYTTKLGGLGKIIRARILQQKEGDDIDKLESYLLSDLRLDRSKQIYTLSGTSGNTFAHGWHFNRDGTQADIVTVERIDYFDGGVEKTRYNIMRHYRLTFTFNPAFDINRFDESGTPITVSLSKVEEVNCTPRIGDDLIWFPNYKYWNMETYYWCTSAGYQAILDADAPIYCFYDTNDQLIMVRYRYHDYGNTEVDAFADIMNSLASCDKSLTSAESDGYVDEIQAGFYTTIIDATGKTGTGELGEVSVWGELTGNTATISPGCGGAIPYDFGPDIAAMCDSSSLPNLDCPDAVWPARTETFEEMIGYCDTFYSATGRQQHFDSTAIIPFRDAESVYLGKLTRKSKSGIHEYVTHSLVGKVTVTFDRDPLCGCLPDRDFVIDEAVWADFSKNVVGHGVSDNSGVDTSNDRAKVDGIGQITLIGLVNHLEASQVNYTFQDDVGTEDLEEDVDEVLGRWTALFDPVLFGANPYPYFDLPFTVTQSLAGELVYFADPNASPAYNDGFKATFDIPVTDIYSNGLFSGWT